MKIVKSKKCCYYQNIKKQKYFRERLHQRWAEEVFMIKNVKSNVQWTYVISDLNGEIVETFLGKGENI